MKILNEIKKLNPLLWAEEKDAIRWNRLCRDNLIEFYKAWLESEKRLAKIKNKLHNLEEQKE